jgi:hypothetical protein
VHDLSYNEARERIPLDVVSNKWTKDVRDEYLVMLKTLQQARMEGIWFPAQEGYEYKWADKVFPAAKAVSWDLRLLLDIGVFKVAPQSTPHVRKTRLLSSLHGL